MQLSKQTLTLMKSPAKFDSPGSDVFNLPEKVIQFGTGVLLRALPDYFIDQANKKGIFNGRIVVVQSTIHDSSAFNDQDGLYTVCARGIQGGDIKELNSINASISRVLLAKDQWSEVLDCARNPDLQIVISNTTEVGIQLIPENIFQDPPQSYPAKLLAFLFERYRFFRGNSDYGMVIVPTELVTNNGALLQDIILELARYNKLENQFIQWLLNSNHFCNSLVDRIVPGKPTEEQKRQLEKILGYTDELITMCELFSLWAIEGSPQVKEILSFHTIDPSVVIVPDISQYRELKLRLLNGTHTFNCGTAFLHGFKITRDAISDPIYAQFTQRLMWNEIAPSIPFAIDESIKSDFASKVFERFGNPFIDHKWQSITTQYTSKMKMRNLPIIKQYYQIYDSPPLYMCTAFACYLLFMRVSRIDGNHYFGKIENDEYEIIDDSIDFFIRHWNNNSETSLVVAVLSDVDFWGEDFNALPGFTETVDFQLQKCLRVGVKEVIKDLVHSNSIQ